jgi:hypothetical protein
MLWSAVPSRKLYTVDLSIWFAILLVPSSAFADLPKGQEELSPEQLWTALADSKAAVAHRALTELVSRADAAIALLKSNVRPARKNDKLEQYLKDLDSRRFALRDAAMREIERRGPEAEPALRRLLDTKPSPELRKRIDELLAKLVRPITDPETLRLIRAVEVLERIGSPPARSLLEALAGGDPDAVLTREARASLARLSAKPSTKP